MPSAMAARCRLWHVALCLGALQLRLPCLPFPALGSAGRPGRSLAVASFWQKQAEKPLGSGSVLVCWCLWAVPAREQGSLRNMPPGREANPPPRSTPSHLMCWRSRFCVGEAVSCLKHKTTADAGCGCLAGELESHKILGAAALSLKGEEKKSFPLEGCAALGPPPHLPEMDLALVLGLDWNNSGVLQTGPS